MAWQWLIYSIVFYHRKYLFEHLLHTAIKASLPDFPSLLNLRYNALQAVFVLMALMAHVPNISYELASLAGYFRFPFNAGSAAVLFRAKASKTYQLAVIFSIPEALGIDDQHGRCSFTYCLYTTAILLPGRRSIKL